MDNLETAYNAEKSMARGAYIISCECYGEAGTRAVSLFYVGM